MKRIPEKTQILAAQMVVCGFLAGALYILIHELGHGIVALCSGARILRFSPIRGYVATSGGFRGYFYRQFFYAAGSLFPSLTAAVCSVLYRRGRSQAYRIFTALYETVCAAALFDWIVTPVLWLLRRAPAGDDCTNFLEFFPLHPLVLSGTAALLACGLLLLVWRRGIAADFAETVRACLDKDR